MKDLPIAGDLSYLVAQKIRRDGEVDGQREQVMAQPHQRPKATVISGQRLRELTERLGGRLANDREASWIACIARRGAVPGLCLSET